MKHKLIIAIIILVVITFTACKKNGLGGEASIVVLLQHHGRTVPSHANYPDTVFIKFDAIDLPGTAPSSFDTYFIGNLGDPHVHCVGLRAGQYFLYGVAIDSTGPYRVTGGLGVKIPWSDRTKETDIDLAVTE